MTKMTTNAKRKLRSNHLGRSGAEAVTQTTMAKIKKMRLQESISYGGFSVILEARPVPKLNRTS
jgi:hypothetical protein